MSLNRAFKSLLYEIFKGKFIKVLKGLEEDWKIIWRYLEIYWKKIDRPKIKKQKWEKQNKT